MKIRGRRGVRARPHGLRFRRRARGTTRAGSAALALSGVAAGAMLAYLLDGRRRRRAARATAPLRRSRRRAARATRIAFVRTEGRARGVLHGLRRRERETPDDVTLAHKVESIVFRDPRFPKSQISINAEEGDVVLRGQVDGPELIRDLEQAVRRIPGVREVENLLHPPGTPPPSSHAGRRLR